VKARFPDARISFITTSPYQDLASALPGVDEVIAIRRRGKCFKQDVQKLRERRPWGRVADLQGSVRSKRLVRALGAVGVLTDRPPRIRRTILLATRIRVGQFRHVSDRQLRVLAPWNVCDDGGSLKLNVPIDTVQAVQTAHGDLINGSIVLVPGAKHATKRWPDEYWRTLTANLPIDKKLVVLGGEGEFPDSLRGEDKGRILDLTGNTNILEAAAVLQMASLVITGDTGPMHLAVAVGTPLVAMFGPTVREYGFYPYRHAQATVLEESLWCRPCSAHGSAKCPLRHHRCMGNLTPERVLAAAESLSDKYLKRIMTP